MKILRKRYIPDEIVDISSDKILEMKENLIITKWVPIKPRLDFSFGVSYTMLDKGWKISKFYDKDNNFMYWYCDIIEHSIDGETYTLTDLLVDVKVYDDGKYEVLDLDELEEALQKNIITKAQYEDALRKLDELVKVIEKGNFPPFKENLT